MSNKENEILKNMYEKLIIKNKENIFQTNIKLIRIREEISEKEKQLNELKPDSHEINSLKQYIQYVKDYELEKLFNDIKYCINEVNIFTNELQRL
jgi:cell division protein FtsL